MLTDNQRDRVADMVDKALPVFEVLDWEWVRPGGQRAPVTGARAALSLERTIQSMIDKPDVRAMTSGGFTVERDQEDPDSLSISLTVNLGYLDAGAGRAE